MRLLRFSAILLVAWALTSSSVGAASKLRVGILSPFSSSDDGVEAFREGLRKLGWIEGQNVDVQIQWAEGKLERLPDLAAQLVAWRPDVIFTASDQGLKAAKLATADVPIVVVVCDALDRFMVSLAAPGGSATGVTCLHSELAAKRLQLLTELIPGVGQVAVLYNPGDANKGIEFNQLEEAGRRLGVAIRGLEVVDPEGILQAFRKMETEHAQALIVLVDPFTIFHRRKIADLAIQQRLPAISGFKEFAQAGNLASYGSNRSALFQRASAYVDKILKGTKPGDLPVEQPTKFELVINLKTANALGLTVPPTMLTRADEVIE
jgi:putative tryptophan/tyrosine transport system substrate-binding protein